MSGILKTSSAALVLAFGVGLAGAAPATAETASGPSRVETTQGSHISTRYRGRVGRHYGGRRYYRGGGYVAGGIAAGILGGIILNEVARPRYYYRTGPYISCGELEYRCDRGEGWACHRLDVDPRC